MFSVCTATLLLMVQVPFLLAKLGPDFDNTGVEKKREGDRLSGVDNRWGGVLLLQYSGQQLDGCEVYPQWAQTVR